jgi:hypothetical protein
MRQKLPLILLGICALFGVFFIRGGITSSIVAENCAEGNCPDAAIGAPSFLSAEDSTTLSAVGVLIITISAAMVIGYLKGKSAPEEKSEQEKEKNLLRH